MAKKQLAQAQGQIKELQEKLRQHDEELKQKERVLENERQALELVRTEKESVEHTSNELRNSNQNLETELAEAKSSVQSLVTNVESEGSYRQEIEEELSRVMVQFHSQKKKVASLEGEVSKRDEAVNSLAHEKLKISEDHVKEKTAFHQKVHELQDVIAQRAQKAAMPLIDIEISACEFAKPFRYFITVELGVLEKRQTDISEPNDRPVFSKSSFLLPDAGPISELVLRAFCVIGSSKNDLGDCCAK